MRLFIDTEFNEFKGALISIALVSEEGHEFYGVLECVNPGPWVAAHVIPILFSSPISRPSLQRKLAFYLRQFDAVHVVADWPEDIQHFCELLITGPGARLDTPPLTMEIRRDLDAVSALPHNALSDAYAIRSKALAVDAMACTGRQAP